MKSAIALVLLFFNLSETAYAIGGEGVGGGGGVVKNDRYMTFYSAGLYVEPSNPAMSVSVQIPALMNLFDYLAGLDLIDAKVKTNFLNAVLPTPQRQYHFASPKELTPEIYRRLMEEYRRVTGVDPAELTLFALTDIPQRTTYLLPGFEKLEPNDQMTILFHEAFWLVYPASSYNQVVNAEMAFQAVLTNPKNYAATYDLINRIGASHLKSIYALAKWDLAQGNLAGLVNKNAEIPLGRLYGQEFLNCFIPLVGINDSGATNICNVYFRKNINSLIALYPKSMILRKIAESLGRGDFVVGYLGETGSGSGPNEEGVVPVREGLWFTSVSVVKKIMACPVHLLETKKVDCQAGPYFRGGHLLLNF